MDKLFKAKRYYLFVLRKRRYEQKQRNLDKKLLVDTENDTKSFIGVKIHSSSPISCARKVKICHPQTLATKKDDITRPAFF